MTTTDQLATARMNLAEALTDASRSLDRTRRKVESVIECLNAINRLETENSEVGTHIANCRAGTVQIEQLNNQIRRMVA